MLRLLVLILPLGLDTFALSAALGVAGLGPGRRVRFGLVIACFEGGMPLVGLLFGAALGQLVGDIADYVAAVALAAVGGYMLLAGDERDERAVRAFASAEGLALLTIGLAVSVDELAIGFVLGLLDVPVVPAVIAIAVQAFVVSQIGVVAGRRLGERFREGAERVAGALLVLLGALLIVSRLAALPL